MARPSITYLDLDIAKAATKLIEQHKRPFIEVIRQELGSRLQQDHRAQTLLLQKQQLDYNRLQERHHQLIVEHQLANEKRHKAQAHVHQLEKQYEKAQGHLELLTQALKKAEADISLLHDNNRELMQEKVGLLEKLSY